MTHKMSHDLSRYTTAGVHAYPINKQTNKCKKRRLLTNTGERAQLVKCLLGKYENVSLIPRSFLKWLGVAVLACNSGETEIGEPLRLTGQLG